LQAFQRYNIEFTPKSILLRNSKKTTPIQAI
jgi:hypothetical protein